MRLIDVDALLNGFDVQKVTEYDESGCGFEYKAVSVKAIEAAPTIEAEPVRHGRWKIERRTTVDYCTGEYDEEPTAICPFCNYREYGSSYGDDYWAKPFNYCPNCGSKMDVEVINDQT